MPTFSVDFCTVSSLDVGAFNHLFDVCRAVLTKNIRGREEEKKKRSKEEKKRKQRVCGRLCFIIRSVFTREKVIQWKQRVSRRSLWGEKARSSYFYTFKNP